MSSLRSSASRLAANAWRWLLLCGIAWSAIASDRLEVDIARLDGDGFTAHGARLSLALADGAMRARIARLDLPATGLRLRELDLDCVKGELDEHHLACVDGRLRLRDRRLGRVSARVDLEVDLEHGAWRLKLRNTRVLGGRIDVTASGAGRDWRLHARARRLPAARLAALVPDSTGIGGGRLDATVDARSDAGGLSLAGRLAWRDLALEHGEILGEGLGGELKLSLRGHGGPLSGHLDLRLDQGELLTPWAYIGATDRVLRLSAGLNIQPTRGRLLLSDARVEHAGAHLDGDAELHWRDAQPLRRLRLRADALPLGRLFDAVLKPVYPDLPVEPSGNLSLHAVVDASGASALNLRLADGRLREVNGHYRIDGLGGALSWRRGQGGEARLHWRSADLYGHVPIGPSRLRLLLTRDAIRAADSIRLPVFDGELVLDDLAITGLDKPVPDIAFDAVLTPIDLRRISKAFGWPPLHGQLSAVIPGVRLRNGQLEVAGTWLVRAFDGRLLIRHLRLRDPFGALPVLLADIELRGLNLRELTETFRFGRITGTLDGDIRGLRLENWRPVAFDAWLRTPDDDHRPHRISQRAVENISDLGGAGMSGALSRSFLSLFEDFGYDRLGVGCRLRDGICAMRGVKDTPQGYYLVEGAGIPRIDIKGFNRHADWELLVRKLIEISNAGGKPIVE